MSEVDSRLLSEEHGQLLELLLEKQGVDALRLRAGGRARPEIVPLSATQRRVWSRGLLAPELPWGNIPMAFRIEGPLRPSALQESLDVISSRHEILRTRFPLRNGEPTQLVAPDSGVVFSVVDLRQRPKEEREAEALGIAAEEEGERPFDLPGDPPLRAKVFRIEEESHVLVITMHQLVADGLSMRLLLRELSLLYAAFEAGGEARLPDLPIQYADYALWQRDWLRGEAARKQSSFWREQLRGAPTRLGLPVEPARAGGHFFRGAMEAFRLPPSLSNSIHELSRQQGVTTFVTLLAAFQALLARCSRRDDVVVGTAISNRHRSETAQLLGNFSNNLLLRMRLKEDASFRTLLERAREVVMGAFANQDLPLEALREDYGLGPGGSALPLLEALFILRDGPLTRYLEIAGAHVTGVPIDLGTAWLDLTLDMTDGPEISGFIDYRTGRFREATIRELVRRFETLLDFVVRRPDEAVSAAPLPEAAEVTVLSESRPDAEEPKPFVAPRDGLERELMGIWEGVLGKRPIGLLDDFFDLGGYSVLAVDLFTRIEKVFGRKLALASLLEAPTIEALARLLREEETPRRWSYLVPVRPGGSRPPFFVVRPIGGNVLSFRDLARHLPLDQPVYGLQAAGLDGKRPPHTRVEDMAADYIAEMRGLQPEGPYYLGGSSFGGLVALEMAQQLRAQGQTVGLLALFDTYGPGYPRWLPASKGFRRKLLRTVYRIDLHVGNLMVGGPREKMAYIREKSNRLRRRFAWYAKKLFGAIRKRLRPLPRALRDVEKASHQSGRDYSPCPYVGPITLFRASKQPPGAYPDPNLGWSPFALGGLEIHEVPGHHGAIFYEPRVGLLAERLQECLERACVAARGASNSRGDGNPDSR